MTFLLACGSETTFKLNSEFRDKFGYLYTGKGSTLAFLANEKLHALKGVLDQFLMKRTKT